jgi:hypothetical protein
LGQNNIFQLVQNYGRSTIFQFWQSFLKYGLGIVNQRKFIPDPGPGSGITAFRDKLGVIGGIKYAAISS